MMSNKAILVTLTIACASVWGASAAAGAFTGTVNALAIEPTEEQRLNKPSSADKHELAKQRKTLEEPDKHGRKAGMGVIIVEGFEKASKDFAFLDGVYLRQAKKGKKPHADLDIRCAHYRMGNVWLYYNTKTDAWLLGPQLGDAKGFAVGFNPSPNPFDVEPDAWQVAKGGATRGSGWRPVQGVRIMKECDNHRECPRAPPKRKMTRVVEMNKYVCARAKYVEDTGMADHAEMQRISGGKMTNLCIRCQDCLDAENNGNVAKYGHPSVDEQCPSYCLPEKDEL